MEIDALAHVHGEAGTDAPTRERVARSILEHGPSTAADLAERLGLTPAAVRRHLDHLVETGAVEPRDQRPRGNRGRGRPAKAFALTEEGRDQFEQHYDDLAAQALRFLRETGGDEAVAAFARSRLEGLEQRILALREEEPDLTPSEALARAMNEEGFAASVRSVPVGEQLCQQHCPVAHVAHEFPQLCEAETELISRVVGRHVQRLATIAHGDGVCTTSIPAPLAVRRSTSTTPDRARTTATNERRST
ncbi:helix-turn-helix transcriptional regulator [Nocardioides caldifontis]|uniref:helix-turn-helix transcriptional regulator n=1 Tax=Nocardioides caldifontis TaxID=2588938 RepID=UPI001EF003AE|nr:helix-turn-helix domain-containing protein [Nocardioides caldifontis]